MNSFLPIPYDFLIKMKTFFPNSETFSSLNASILATIYLLIFYCCFINRAFNFNSVQFEYIPNKLL